MIRIGFIKCTKFLYDTIRLFAEQEHFEVAFVWTCKDEDSYEFKWQNFKFLAEQIQCPFIYKPVIEDQSKDLNADVVVSINFVNLIPQYFIDKFRFGVINAHAGDLPRYRGNACPNWAILNGENEVALTIHQMDASLDSGPVITKEFLKIDDDTYIGDVYSWLQAIIPHSILKSVELLNDGFVPAEQVGGVLRTFPRKPDDGRLMLHDSIEQNLRVVRASSRPFSGAYLFLNETDVRVRIFRAERHKLEYEFLAVDGQILEYCEAAFTFCVAMKDGVLKVNEFSIDGLSTKQAFELICGSMRNRLR